MPKGNMVTAGPPPNHAFLSCMVDVSLGPVRLHSPQH